MQWVAYTYHDQLPLAMYESVHYSFLEVPDAIAFVDIIGDNGVLRRLQGMDNYWVSDNRYGMYNDPDNYNIYEGLQAAAYSAEGLFELEIDPQPPEGAVVKRGIMIPDEHAQAIGLI